MTILDVVSNYEETIEIFRSYDEQAGECLCCMALFNTIAETATKYHLDLAQLLSQLETAAQSNKSDARQVKNASLGQGHIAPT
jgi:iron-sulfur cluster repair protein YtfE (RIC family)